MRRLSGFRLILILVVAALLGGSIYFGVAYYQEYNREGTLEDDIAAIDVQIAAMARFHDIPGLEAELAALEAELEEVHFSRDDIEAISANIYVLVLNAATTAGVEFSFDAPDEASMKEVDGSGYEYRLFSYDVSATGALTGIFSFLSEIEDNMPYDTVKVHDVDLAYDSATESWEVSFEILVFAQPI